MTPDEFADLRRTIRDHAEAIARLSAQGGASTAELSALRRDTDRMQAAIDREPTLDAMRERMKATPDPDRPPDRPTDRAGLSLDLPSPDTLSAYGTALRVWGFRTVAVAFGLVALWKFATGDLLASIERLWWVVNPPETVEEVQRGALPDSGVVPPPVDEAPPAR